MPCLANLNSVAICAIQHPAVASIRLAAQPCCRLLYKRIAAAWLWTRLLRLLAASAGFENFGNTCYANSVVQSLFFCRAFRDRLLAYAKDLPPDAEESLLNTLALLFKEVRHPI